MPNVADAGEADAAFTSGANATFTSGADASGAVTSHAISVKSSSNHDKSHMSCSSE